MLLVIQKNLLLLMTLQDFSLKLVCLALYLYKKKLKVYDFLKIKFKEDAEKAFNLLNGVNETQQGVVTRADLVAGHFHLMLFEKY